MKAKVFIVISLLSVLLCGLCGCRQEVKMQNKTQEQSSSGYMAIVSHERFGDIICDTRTGVEYWRSDGYYNNGDNSGELTVLVDKDGKPLIYEGYKEDEE